MLSVIFQFEYEYRNNIESFFGVLSSVNFILICCCFFFLHRWRFFAMWSCGYISPELIFQLRLRIFCLFFRMENCAVDFVCDFLQLKQCFSVVVGCRLSALLTTIADVNRHYYSQCCITYHTCTTRTRIWYARIDKNTYFSAHSTRIKQYILSHIMSRCGGNDDDNIQSNSN